MECWIKWNARTARRARAAPDSHRLFRISLQREFSGWIEAAEQIHQFTLDDRDRSPIAIEINKRADQPGQREGHCLWIIHCL
jgi:hypothetical protein